jgi:hypothetical protein
VAQRDVIELLERERRALSVGEISKLLGEVSFKISRDLNKLIQYHEVKYIEIDTKTAMEKYKCRRRMKIYYVDDSC